MLNKKKKEIEKLNAEVIRLKEENNDLFFKITYKNAEILRLKQQPINIHIEELISNNVKLGNKIKELESDISIKNKRIANLLDRNKQLDGLVIKLLGYKGDLQ